MCLVYQFGKKNIYQTMSSTVSGLSNSSVMHDERWAPRESNSPHLQRGSKCVHVGLCKTHRDSRVFAVALIYLHSGLHF